MEPQPEDVEAPWPGNYFNYFTEIEERFQKARGTALFLLSPLDWALIETWKGAGIPLEAVLRGIDAAFEKWRSKKSRVQAVNSLAYCAQAVLVEAQTMAGTAPRPSERSAAPAPFTVEELAGYLAANAAALRAQSGYEAVAGALGQLSAESESLIADLESAEQRISALEDKMIAIARTRQTDADLADARRELDAQLRPYRGRMTAEQIVLLERQYLERKLLESAGLPRLSLFYLR